ncbi:MAG: prolyl oligopeptidase family serine peptidase [Nakamurella sp.]
MTTDGRGTIEAHTVRYGRGASQFAQLSLPSGDDDVPVVVVVHGGFWRQRYNIDLAKPLAADLAGYGVAGYAIEYGRVGDDGSGGWPQTFIDVAAAVDELAVSGQQLAAGRLDLSRVVAVGHSAGGHLAGWLAHRTVLPTDGFDDSADASPPGDVGPSGSVPGGVALIGAVSQAGVLDLRGACAERLGNGAVIDFLGGTAIDFPERYDVASPLSQVGDGARVICVHGTANDDVPLSQSERYVAAARAAGDPVELVRLPGVGHMDLIDPAHEAWVTCRTLALRLCQMPPS